MIVVNPSTRQFSIPGADLTFGVEDDSGSEIKHFQCPRYVGNNLDLAGCFVRMNYRNANGEVDSYLVEDLSVDGNNILFSWLLSPKVTRYKGQIKFVMCVVGPDTKLKWHTTLGTGQVLEGLEPDAVVVESGTADVVAQLIAMVEAQTAVVEKAGADQIVAVKSAAETARMAAVNEIEAKRANSLASIPSDYTALSNTVESLVRGRAGSIICDAAGPVISVSDASNMAIQGMRIFGRSVQDGVPSPSTPVEIKSIDNPAVRVCGENILDPDELTPKTQYHGIVAEYEGDGIFHFYGTVTSTQATSHFTTELAIPIDPNHGYTLCAEVVEGSITGQTRLHPYLAVGKAPGNRMNWLAVKVDSESAVGSVAYNTAKATDFMADGKFITRFWVYVALPTVGDVIDIRMRIWATRTNVPVAYKPYTGRIVETTYPLRGIPVTSGGNYTDENGQQWLCDEVDLERGVYVQRLVKHELSSSLLFSSWTNGEREIGIIIRGLKWDYYPRTEPIALCSHFEPDVNGSIREGQLGFRLLGDYPYIYLLHTEGIAMTADEWRAFFDAQIAAGTPITLVIKAESVTETPLSETEIAAYRALHTYKPNTTIVNDSGAYMSVEYAADTKLYIDNLIKNL